MKAIKVLLITVWVLAIQLHAANAQVFSVKSYKVSVKGTSSLHDWESSVDKLEARGSFSLSGSALSDVKDVVVKIPVKAIKSTKGKMMDNKTWDAFNYEKNPTITFTLSERKINPAKQSLIANGTLTMAGVTKSVELHLVYKVLPGGELQVTGEHKLLMSAFKMEPPTAMMGTIKVGDEIAVDVEIILSNVNNTL